MKKKCPIPFSLHFRNAFGFSLTEVLIAMGLAGGLAVFMMKFFDQSSKQQSTISQRADFESLVSTVKMILETQCDVNFKDKEFNSSGLLMAQVAQLNQKLPNGTPHTILDSTKPIDGLKVNPFDITVPSTLQGRIIGSLIVSAEKDKGSSFRKSFGVQRMIRKIPISLNIDGSRKISSCQSGASNGAIPSGAVMAFNRPNDDCPDGWKRSDGTKSFPSDPNRSASDLRGRNIIGTGLRPQSGQPGEVRTNFTLRKNDGGEEKHKLELNELTRHRHGYRYVVKPTDRGDGSDHRGRRKNYLDFDYAQNPFTEIEGGSDAFNVMDPYVALTYCEKE